MENPYQSPQSMTPVPAAAGTGGRARQIPTVAILLMVQGGLELLMGGFYVLFGGVFAFMAVNPDVGQVNANPPFEPQVFGWLIVGIYAAMGLGAFAVAVLKLFAGWRNYSFRGRNWGIAALVSGVASAVTCYCFPTALALMIYGLIVYLNPQSAAAFACAAQGQPRDQILWQLQQDAG
jgi:hypothetical protein